MDLTSMEVDVCKKTMRVASEVPNIEEVVTGLVRFVLQHCQVENYPISLALSEAVTNAMIHGNKYDPKKHIIAEACIRPGRLIFKISDEGAGFDHERVEDPTCRENLFRENGRGIFFIRNFMDEVIFNRAGNEITMVKYLKSD